MDDFANQSGSSRRLQQEAAEVGWGSKFPLGAPACSSASRAGRRHWHWGDPGKGESHHQMTNQIDSFHARNFQSWLAFSSNINSQNPTSSAAEHWLGNAINRNTGNIALMPVWYWLRKELQLKSTCRKSFVCVEISEPLAERKSNNQVKKTTGNANTLLKLLFLKPLVISLIFLKYYISNFSKNLKFKPKVQQDVIFIRVSW